MSSDEGSNGNKRKAEESALEDVNKRVRFGDTLTSSGIITDDQAQEDTNWMKYVQIEHEEVPECQLCGEKHSFNIKLTSFKKHWEDEHNEDSIMEDEQNWIFAHFDIISDKQQLKCTHCDLLIKVEFEGPLVEHITVDHGIRANQDATGEPSQGSHRDAEETVESRTSKLIDYLFQKYQNRPSTDPQLQEAQNKMKERTWSRVYWNINTENYKINHIKCKLCEQYFNVYPRFDTYEDHMFDHHEDELKEARSTSDKEWLEYFLFENNAMRCNLCKIYFPLAFHDYFTPHCVKEHKKKQGDDSLSIQDERSITNFLSKFVKDSLNKVRALATNDARQKAWWMKYCEKVEENRVFCIFRKCSQKMMNPIPVYLKSDKIESHIKEHLPETEFGINANNWEHFLFENCILRCKYCYEPLYYTFETNFHRKHLKNIHNVLKSTEGGESSQETNNDAKMVELITTLLQYLIKNINVKK